MPKHTVKLIAYLGLGEIFAGFGLDVCRPRVEIIPAAVEVVA